MGNIRWGLNDHGDKGGDNGLDGVIGPTDYSRLYKPLSSPLYTATAPLMRQARDVDSSTSRVMNHAPTTIEQRGETGPRGTQGCGLAGSSPNLSSGLRSAIVPILEGGRYHLDLLDGRQPGHFLRWL